MKVYVADFKHAVEILALGLEKVNYPNAHKEIVKIEGLCAGWEMSLPNCKHSIRVWMPDADQRDFLAMVSLPELVKLLPWLGNAFAMWLEATQDNKLSITVEGKHPVTITQADHADWFEVVTTCEEFVGYVDSDKLLKALKIGSSCTISKPSVQGFPGVRLKLTTDQLTVASQDGWRLAECTVDATHGYYTGVKILVDYGTLKNLLKILPKKQRQVHISRSEKRVSFAWSDSTGMKTYYNQEIPEDHFFDYGGFFTDEAENQNPVIIKRKDFLQKIKSLNAVSKAVDYRTAFVFTKIKGESYSISLETEAQGLKLQETISEYDTRLKPHSNHSEVYTVHVTGKYLEDILKTWDCEKFTWSCRGSGEPVYLLGDGYKAIVMALHLG